MNLRSGLQMPEKSTLPSGVRGVAAGARADPRPVVLMASPCPATVAAFNAHAATAMAAIIATAMRVFIMTSSFCSSAIHNLAIWGQTPFYLQLAARPEVAKRNGV